MASRKPGRLFDVTPLKEGAFIGLGYAAQNRETLDIVTAVKMKLDRSSQPAASICGGCDT